VLIDSEVLSLTIIIVDDYGSSVWDKENTW